ncbi:hypothetical protein GZH53_04020 [Flavihumibacter sp. R14]|nr:hypothetical protein [Flavihumibacter soli]
MNKQLFTFLLLLLFLLPGTTLLKAQDTLTSADKSLAGQYREIIQKSKNNDQGFKIVNPARLSDFNKNFSDSLRQTRSRLTEAQNKIASQTKTINALQADLAGKDKSLTESRSLVDGINLLGIVVSKSTYHWIMWGLVILLGAVLAFVVFRSGGYRREARYRTKLFSELSDEFQQFKTKSNDKEKRLARELQTEKNRVDELLKR